MTDARAPILWPNGYRFAFTVFDDTDNATIHNVRPVYDLLADLGFRTTKSVWPVSGPDVPRIGGSTCADPEYLAWTLSLRASGFEIGSHGATYHTSPRELVIEGMDRFREIYGHDPDAYANHSGCRESMYWGPARVSGVARLAYHAMTRFRNRGMFRGDVPGDPLFWGDICQARVRYMRNFTFDEIDTLAACPQMPYHDPQRPFVNAWFASAEGADVTGYNDRISEAAQDRLVASGGACIMYTHFASGFWDGDRIEQRFETLMRRLAGLGGWYVPVTTLLDHIVAQRGVTRLDRGSRRSLELRWLASKARVGST